MPEPTSAPASAPAPSTSVSLGSSTPSSSPASTPTSSPGSDTGDHSLSAAIDSLLSAPAPATGAGLEAGGTGDGAAAPAPAQSPVPSPEAPADTEPPPAAGEEGAVEVDDDGDDTDIDTAQTNEATPTNALDLKTPRGKRIYGGYKAYKALTEALGRDLTVAEAQDHIAAYSDKLAMEHEFADVAPTNPAAAANWLQYWHQTSPEGMANVARQMADYFANTGDKGAYVALAQPIINRYVNNLYNQATAEANPEIKKAMLFAARMVDWHTSGQYREDAALPTAPDALAQREQAVQQQWQQVQQFQQQQTVANQTYWNQQLDATNNSALEQAVVSTLEPLKSALPSRLYKAACNDFYGTIQQHLAKDVEGERIYNINRNRAAQRMSSEDQQALTGQFAQRAQRAATALKGQFLKEYGATAQRQSTQRHQALAAAATAGKAPQTAGAPISQSITSSNRQYTSKVERMEGTIDELLGVKKP
jgi:hypothetical protein